MLVPAKALPKVEPLQDRVSCVHFRKRINQPSQSLSFQPRECESLLSLLVCVPLQGAGAVLPALRRHHAACHLHGPARLCCHFVCAAARQLRLRPWRRRSTVRRHPSGTWRVWAAWSSHKTITLYRLWNYATNYFIFLPLVTMLPFSVGTSWCYCCEIFLLFFLQNSSFFFSLWNEKEWFVQLSKLTPFNKKKRKQLVIGWLTIH